MAPPRGPLAAIAQELRAALAGIEPRAAIACTVAMSVLIVSNYQGDTSYFRSHFAAGLVRTKVDYFSYLYWQLASFALYLPIPLLAAALTPGFRVRDCGLGLGDWRFGLKATGLLLAVFLPVVFLASRTPAFGSHYPLCQSAKATVGAFALYELSFALYFVAWELLFRGYLLFSLKPSMGKMAVFAQMMPFAVVHFGKPEAEVFGAIVAGVALGLLALRTRSFWYGALLHIGAALALDLLATFAPAS